MNVLDIIFLGGDANRLVWDGKIGTGTVSGQAEVTVSQLEIFLMVAEHDTASPCHAGLTLSCKQVILRDASSIKQVRRATERRMH